MAVQYIANIVILGDGVQRYSKSQQVKNVPFQGTEERITRICMMSLFDTELTSPVLTIKQRFQLSLKLILAMQSLGNRNITPHCIGLHGLVVTKCLDDIVSVTIGCHQYPTDTHLVKQLGPYNFIGSTDDEHTPNTAVQLLGRLLLMLFFHYPNNRSSKDATINLNFQLALCLQHSSPKGVYFLKRDTRTAVSTEHEIELYQLIRSMLWLDESRIGLSDVMIKFAILDGALFRPDDEFKIDDKSDTAIAAHSTISLIESLSHSVVRSQSPLAEISQSQPSLIGIRLR